MAGSRRARVREKRLHQWGGVYGDVVVQDRAVLGGHRFDMHDLKGLVLEIVNGASEDVVSLALEFRRGASCALLNWQGGGVQAIGVGIAGSVFRLQLHFGSKLSGSLGLVVEPARRSDENEDNYENYGQVVGPAAAFIGPENSADNASP